MYIEDKELDREEAGIQKKSDTGQENQSTKENRQNDKIGRRRNRIKNIAIIFLVVLLVLTFFSNTIMNITLPEVATQYVTSGDISPQVRGSGTAQIEDPYNVTISDTRVIKSVQKHVGDDVKTGDVIYELEDTESDELKQARKDYNTAQTEFEKALFSSGLSDSVITRIRQGNFLSEDAMQKELADANDAYNTALSNDNAAADRVTRLGGSTSDTPAGDGSALSVALYRKQQTAAALTTATARKDQTQKDISAELDLKASYQTMKDASDKVSDLEKKDIGASVTAPVDGTVETLAYNPGESTTAGSTAAVIKETGKNVTVSFTCTKEEAAKLKVGTEAQPQNAWNYSGDFKATLTNIGADTSDPTNNKLLTFTVVSDEVSVGDNVALSVGESAKSYDLVVPNSAVRQDNNGYFLLVVVSKSTPLSNRYIANRVGITVITHDDVNSAVSGDLSGNEYVITTTSKPVSAGQQVRLAEDAEAQ